MIISYYERMVWRLDHNTLMAARINLKLAVLHLKRELYKNFKLKSQNR